MQGLLIINKPIGFTSQDVDSKIKKILNIKKVGHCGTLDPGATGVLPVLVGDYTKISKYLVEHDKTYSAKIKLGIATDSGDGEGNVINRKDVPDNINEEIIIKVLNKFKGETLQIPPMYSAIKVNGKKLYEYAREGKTIEVEPRNIYIDNIKLLEFNKIENEIYFEVSCSKGTYIRTLCEDISKELGIIGYMSYLNRIKVDKFDIKDAITLEELETRKNDINFLENKFLKLENLFINFDKIVLKSKQKELFLNGVKLNYNLPDGVYNIYSNEKTYIGLGVILENKLKRDVVID